MGSLKGRHTSGSEHKPGRRVADISAKGLLYPGSHLQAEIYSSIVYLFNLRKHSKEHSFLSDQKHKIFYFKGMLPPLPEIHLSILEYRSQGNTKYQGQRIQIRTVSDKR